MRAMSLAIDEGESEQSEIKNLQEKLESTTRLVYTLSQQLTDLKEQVGLADQTLLHLPVSTSGHLIFSPVTLPHCLFCFP